MGSSGEQHHVTLGVVCQALEQLEALLAALATLSAGVGFVHNDEFGAKALEGFAPAFRLDVVQTDDGERMGIKHRGAGRQVALQPCGTGAANHHSLDVEAVFQFALPLLAQVRRAQHCHAVYFTSVEHLAGNQCAFDGFADTYVIGNQQPNSGLFQGHEQRHQLVSTGLHGNVAKAAERARPAAQLELQGVHQQLAGRVIARLGNDGPGESGWADGLKLQRQVNQGLVLLAATQRAQAQGVGSGFGQHYPFAATGRNKAAGIKVDLQLTSLHSFGSQPGLQLQKWRTG